MTTIEKGHSIRDAIAMRMSVRAFKPDPVPRQTIEEILNIARRAPSWANTQPWEVAVVMGEPLAAIKEGFCAKMAAGVAPHSEVAGPEFPEPYSARRQETSKKIFNTLGIGRDDTERRRARNAAMQRFLGAPAGLIFYMDERLGPWSMLDLGLFMQTIMLAAIDFGLGTCPMAAVVYYPDVIRSVLPISATKRIYVGMALGYPDEDAVANQTRSERLELDEFVTWFG